VKRVSKVWAANTSAQFGKGALMSRLGKQPIEIPANVKAIVDKGLLKIEGPKGKLQLQVPAGIEFSLDKNVLTARRLDEAVGTRAKHGLIRTLASNMVFGVANGYERKLEIVGVGFKAAVKGPILNMQLGFSHPIDFQIPTGVQVKVEGTTMIVVQSPDKALLGETCAKIRGFRPPEPYQGKGVRYSDEKVRRKAGKAAAGGK
jgi:large subunit ribosomal protein L6